LLEIYADGCLISGSNEGFNAVINGLKQHNFCLKMEDFLSDYLSCKIEINRKKEILLFMQPHLIKRFRRQIARGSQQFKYLCNPWNTLFQNCDVKYQC
jgi:hypothetical protein